MQETHQFDLDIDPNLLKRLSDQCKKEKECAKGCKKTVDGIKLSKEEYKKCKTACKMTNACKSKDSYKKKVKDQKKKAKKNAKKNAKKKDKEDKSKEKKNKKDDKSSPMMNDDITQNSDMITQVSTQKIGFVPPSIESEYKTTTQTKLERAITNDKFTIMNRVHIKDNFGIHANIVTNQHMGKSKNLYVLGGSAKGMGYCMGLLAEPDISKMTNEYITHILPSFLSYRVDVMISSKAVDSLFYNTLIDRLAQVFKVDAPNNFRKNIKYIPPSLIEEMKGIAKGCKVANPDTLVNMDNLISLNYGITYMASLIYSGNIKGLLGSDSSPLSKALTTGSLTSLIMSDLLVVPDFCDGFYVKSDACKDSSDAYFARDMQLTNAGVFQDVNGLMLCIPNDGRKRGLFSNAPGMVGAFTGLNESGLGMGFDMVRSGSVSTKGPGLDAMLLLRHVIDNASDVSEGKKLMLESHRGSSWIFMLSSIDGCLTVESTMAADPPGSMIDPLRNVSEKTLDLFNKVEPFAEVLKQNPHEDSGNGLYFRTIGYEWPEAFQVFNDATFAKLEADHLIKHADFRDNHENTNGGYVFKNFKEENNYVASVQNNYFPPYRVMPEQNFSIISNQFIIPQARVTQMSVVTNILASTADAIQWRYDHLNHLILQRYGQIDVDECKDIITMLSPWKEPHYPINESQYQHLGLQHFNKDNVQIQGVISILDYKNMIYHNKSSFWGEDWITIHLRNYL